MIYRFGTGWARLRNRCHSRAERARLDFTQRRMTVR
jgi:hypothetical protein